MIPPTQNEPSRALQLAVLAAGILAISSGSILVRLAQDEAVPSLVIALWRTLLATLFVAPFALAKRRGELTQMGREKWLLALLAGLLLGIHFATWISSLALTSIISSTVLVSTAPIWVGLASPILLREPLSRPLKQGIALAMAGTVVVSLSELSGLGRGNGSLLGNVLALVGGISVAGYLLIGRRLRPHLSLLSYTTVVYGTSALTLLVFNLISGTNLWRYPPQVYLLFLAIAAFPQLIGHTSFNWALSFLPAAFVSIAAISEPVGATVLAMIFFQEFPGPAAVVGSILILAGVYLASRYATA